MHEHPQLAVLCVAEKGDESLASFSAYLKALRHVRLETAGQLPQDLAPYGVIISAGFALCSAHEKNLTDFVRAGGGWLAFAGSADKEPPGIFGVRFGPAGPEAEVRVMFSDKNNPLAVRLPDALYATGAFRPLEPVATDAETVLYADWHYTHQPVLITRREGSGSIACTTLVPGDTAALQQVLYRVLRRLGGCTERPSPLGVGILGYAPSVGKLHGCGAMATPGLRLHGACDLSPERLDQACKDFSGMSTYTSSAALAADPAIDLVIIATAPSTHAKLSIEMLRAGKHVICEKPLALTHAETDAMLAAAEANKVHLSCHQNRRWDQDYLAIRQALAEGLIGDLFYMETFVGGFSHPCGYWHSHAPVSGGASYDWGGHYLDWIVGLMPGRVHSVRATSHKRVWHDVTNNDQERLQLRFAGGQEAEFMHSDIAAARKPKWYLLGTEGAIIGAWRDVAAYEIDPVLYYHRRDIPATEMTPELSLHRREHSGRIVARPLDRAPRQDFGFHRNIADHLLTGEALAAPVEDSAHVVAVLEAAARSMARGGAEEVLDA
jgi:scyllo-inositol 2-dehydrogenase (NADP+)